MWCVFELFGKPSWVNVWEIINAFSFLLDAVHVNTVGNAHMKASSLKYFIRTHFLWGLHYFGQFLCFLLLISVQNSQRQRFWLNLWRSWLGFEPFIDLKLTVETASHVFREEREISKVEFEEGIYLVPCVQDLRINCIQWGLNKSSIICDIKRIGYWAIIYYILFRGVFPFIKGISRDWGGFVGAKSVRAFLTFLLGPYFSVYAFHLG